MEWQYLTHIVNDIPCHTRAKAVRTTLVIAKVDTTIEGSAYCCACSCRGFWMIDEPIRIHETLLYSQVLFIPIVPEITSEMIKYDYNGDKQTQQTINFH